MTVAIQIDPIERRDMDGIKDEGTEAPTVQPEDEDFAWQGSDEKDETPEVPAELLTEVSDRFGLDEDEAEELGEKRLREMLKKSEPVVEKTEPKATPKPKKSTGTFNDVSLEGFDDRLVKELEYERGLTRKLSERLDAVEAMQDSGAMDDLRGSMKKASKAFPDVSPADMKRAEGMLEAMRKGYGDTVPPDEELIDMALRATTGASANADRSDQFVSRPTHRNTGGKRSKETPRDTAIRHVTEMMNEG